MSGLVLDFFAGGGGASTGIERALGRSPDVAVNHDPEAVAMHQANHPATRHLCGDVWHVGPRTVVGEQAVDFAWFSPDCTHFSKAKGGKPRSAKRRALAWVVVRWAREVRPKVIALENVEEFLTWGPLLGDGSPCPKRKGKTFRAWVAKLRALGYVVEWRELRACDYGAPTTRRRLFLIARCDGKPIVWPAPTHGPGRPQPWRTAAEIIDWAIPCPSIFERRKPLATPTLRRIARGVRRFVLEAREPFVVGDAAHTMIHQSNGERPGQAPRIYDLDKPLGTVVAGGVKHALVAAFLAKHYGGNEGPGSSLALPIGTVTTQDHHALVTASSEGAHRAAVRAFLTRYNGTGDGQPVQLPLGTVTTRDRFGLVVVAGQAFEFRDIGMRMLVPRELYRAQGFPDTYEIAPVVNGKRLTQTAQIRMAGNSAPPDVVAAIVAANVGSRRAVAA